MTQYDTTGTVNLFIKISSVNQTLYWGRSHQTLQTLWDISFSVVIPPPPPRGLDTLQRKMRYHENKSVVNVNALVVTGKAIYAGSCYKVICHFTFAVEIRWCYHPKGTIHFLKLKKKKTDLEVRFFCNSFFNIRSERVMEWRRAVFAGCL